MQLIDIFSTRNILIYLFIINLVGFYMMWSDKRKAKWGKWRIPEQTLFIVTALGGGIGTIAFFICSLLHRLSRFFCVQNRTEKKRSQVCKISRISSADCFGSFLQDNQIVLVIRLQSLLFLHEFSYRLLT